MADRQALIAEEERDARAGLAEDEPEPPPAGEAADGKMREAEEGENGDTMEAEPSAGEIMEVKEEDERVESIGGGDALEEVPERTHRRARIYKIQEVIKRRQILLVQVVKEERGTKGAALTTYLSLAGRYSVLMPNTGRGGGISRKVTDGTARKRLKEIAQSLEVPEGMGIILRTAGANRTKTEIKRDFEYLLRLWENVRELTLGSTAPTLVYEEGSLIKRAIRDLYNKDIDEVLIAGDDAYREAKDFMRMLMPSHAKNVKPYREPHPIFSKFGVEAQLDAMFNPQVQLKSGGYLVLNQTEALVAIDVNSGRSTKEHNIEDTALRTNLEAAEELARQLRLRDLAGLIVIDFIDMEEKRNNRAVERRLKECLKQDRARIQVGRISHFGLLEMSRQRIRTGVVEGSTELCPHCRGAGLVRSVESCALQILRVLEEQLFRSASHNLVVRARTAVALYALNQKRTHLRALEERFGITVTIAADETVSGADFFIDRGEPATPVPQLRPQSVVQIDSVTPQEEPEEEIDEEEVDTEVEAETDGELQAESRHDAAGEQRDSGRKRRRRRRRRARGEPGEPAAAPVGPVEAAEAQADIEAGEEDAVADEAAELAPAGAADSSDARAPDGGRRRRNRRGDRRGRPDAEVVSTSDSGTAGRDDVESRESEAAEAAATVESAPVTAAAEAIASLPEHFEPVAAGGAAQDGQEPAEPPEPPRPDEPVPPAELPPAEEEAPVEEPDAPRSPAVAAAPERQPDTIPGAEPPAERAREPEPEPGAPAAAFETPRAPEMAAEAERQPVVAVGAEPQLEPAASATAADEEPKPRRSGWWQRRSLFRS